MYTPWHAPKDFYLDDFHGLRPVGGFRVILADPPWLFELRSEKGEEKSPQAQYPCMTTKEIKQIPVDYLAAKDCALFIWVTWPMMPVWESVIKAWGFEYAGLAWEWRKYNPETGKYAFGGGYGTRKNLEPCLLATRGNPSLKSELPDDLFGVGRVAKGVHSVRDWMEAWPLDEIRAPRREHSRKPDEQYERIETLFDGPYVELFARQRRQGWSAWGNQTDKFGESAA
jgi:N6-adenosine-specific RNA methylase IME4